MIQNIYFFTGEEKYLLNKEIKRWKDTFVSKFSADSVFSFWPGNFDMAAFRQTASESGLFFSKKLVFVYGLPLDTDQTNKVNADTNESFIDYFLKNPNISQDVLLIFVSYAPDKRTKLFKYLSENVNMKKFDKLNPAQLRWFVSELLPGVKFADEALDYFTFKVWSDLYRVSFEAEKLQLYIKANNLNIIDKKIINDVVFGMVETNAFLFMDYVLQSPQKAIEIIDKLHNDWQDSNQTLWMIYRCMKLYVFMIDLYEQWIRDSKQIASMTAYHPFAVSKQMKIIDKVIEKKVNIKSFYESLIDLDVGIKTWRYPESYFWLAIKKMVDKMSVA